MMLCTILYSEKSTRWCGVRQRAVEMTADDNSKNVITLIFMFGVFMLCACAFASSVSRTRIKTTTTERPDKNNTDAYRKSEWLRQFICSMYFRLVTNVKLQRKKPDSVVFVLLKRISSWDRLRCILMSIAGRTRSSSLHFHLHAWFLSWFLRHVNSHIFKSLHGNKWTDLLTHFNILQIL